MVKSYNSRNSRRTKTTNNFLKTIFFLSVAMKKSFRIKKLEIVFRFFYV